MEEKNMKKLWAILLAMVLAMGAITTAVAEFAPVSKDELKIGLVYIGDVVDGGYTYAHHQGILKMQEALGLTDEQLVIKTNVAEGSGDEAAIRELIEAGCQIIFGNSFGYMFAFNELAEEYPEVIFSHCSGYMSNDVNFNNYFGAIYQARYLSGIAAGLKTQSNKIGYVAAMSNPEVDGGCNAFALGVQKVNPDATVYIQYTNSWYDPTLERQTAEALLDFGCDVIAQHVDTAMPQIAAQERGVWGCGYNADMTKDAPQGHLVAPIWNWDAVYIKEVQSVIDGTWAPENLFLDMADGLIALSPLSENIAEGTQEVIEEEKAKIIEGTFDVFEGPIYDNEGTLRVEEGQKLEKSYIAGEIDWLVKGVEVR
ncbi:MAG: BMP family ABC transporter substrate-binding protein [Clostridiales bacterium]|nr:BMP family ABC transporter substrate-binding protein [Clostridiales bacterium]